MVRVISVHHFANQDIHKCEEPLAVTTAPPDRLLLAQAQHAVEVRGLAEGGDVLFTFPTVDEVRQMVYCCNGDYIAALERKQNRQGTISNYVRIYCKWDIVNNPPDSTFLQQPMRARIAGQVTPSSAQISSGGLEMIELPLKRDPNGVACCQVTGNLIVVLDRTLVLYYFKVRAHDISRQKFIDFEESPVSLEMCFTPMKVEMCEDIVACMSKQYLHVFKVGQLEKEKTVQNTCIKNEKDNGTKKETDSEINWDSLLEAEFNKNLAKGRNAFEDNWVEKLHNNSFPLTIHLPGITTQQGHCSTNTSTNDGTPYRNMPFKVAPLEMTINVKCSSPSEGPSEETSVTNLLQLQLYSPEAGDSNMGVLVGPEEFRCLVVKPMYLRQAKPLQNQKSNKKISTNHPMRSPYYKNLGSVVCFVATQQEGFLYHFPMIASREPLKLQQAACVSVYPFTAPVLHIALESYLLHALTEMGLETYTLKSSHQLIRENESLESAMSRKSDDPVCLVGLRPFLGVEHLLLSDSYLSLLACSEGSSISSQDSHSTNWTLYSLKVPSPLTLYNDIMTVASQHRWSSPATYCHLLTEAHTILQIATHTVSWLSKQHHSVGIITPNMKNDEATQLEDTLRESCALLGDYYINCDCEEDWTLAAHYYKMTGFSPINIIERVKNLEIPKETDIEWKKENQLKALMKYLKTSLLFMHHNSDSSFNPSIQDFTNTLLDLFEKYSPSEVSTLVLHSALLREYATDRVLNVMKKQLSVRPVPKSSDALALVLLCIQKGSPEQANAVLSSFEPNQLSAILFENSMLLFETTTPVKSMSKHDSMYSSRRNDQLTTFSELSVVLMDSKPRVLSGVLSELVASQKMSLQEVLQVFLEYLPSRIGISGSSASLVLQVFLENHFGHYFELYPDCDFKSVYDLPVIEALKILVRSYLSDLQCYNLASKKNTSDKSCTPETPEVKDSADKSPVLFESCHFEFLQKMPPFASNLSEKLLAHQRGENTDPKIQPSDEDKGHKNESLVKLQCLLCSGKLPKECVVEVYQFVQTHPQLHGNLSLQVLCVSTKEATNVLLNFCPQTLLQFAKDRYTVDSEYKHLLSLLHKKISALSDELLKPYYMRVMNEILTYLAQTYPLESLCQMLPAGTEYQYASFIHMGQQVTHANHIRSLIMITGRQLLGTLKL
ncbi:Hermansky-Pudlak syndrome 3 protein homolog [Schistocerca nitens]|uniref:Hermansky-Pudlak syndrome 3 protein homolog n=1 Tax=Schistocerca nitens TaxID=7011 RepID=UPI0021182573|nr:Hermansky-Pudlak syndrome 3 protein homolog [Schistocerca nitens]